MKGNVDLIKVNHQNCGIMINTKLPHTVKSVKTQKNNRSKTTATSCHWLLIFPNSARNSLLWKVICCMRWDISSIICIGRGDSAPVEAMWRKSDFPFTIKLSRVAICSEICRSGLTDFIPNALEALLKMRSWIHLGTQTYKYITHNIDKDMNIPYVLDGRDV